MRLAKAMAVSGAATRGNGPTRAQGVPELPPRQRSETDAARTFPANRPATVAPPAPGVIAEVRAMLSLRRANGRSSA